MGGQNGAEGGCKSSRVRIPSKRNLKHMYDSFQRKEKELAAVAAKIEDEQSLGIKMQKQVKELAVSSSSGHTFLCLRCYEFYL